jgi:hypothetical protein
MTRSEFIQRAVLALCGRVTTTSSNKDGVDRCVQLADAVDKVAPFDKKARPVITGGIGEDPDTQ